MNPLPSTMHLVLPGNEVSVGFLLLLLNLRSPIRQKTMNGHWEYSVSSHSDKKTATYNRGGGWTEEMRLGRQSKVLQFRGVFEDGKGLGIRRALF